MDILLLASLSRYLDDSFVNDARRLRHPKGEKASTAGDPKQPTKTLLQRLQPTLNQSHEIIVTKNTIILKTVIPLQNLRPGYSLNPQGCYQPADPQPTSHPQVQQSCGQPQQDFRQPPQDFEQSSQSSRQFPLTFRQFSHDSGWPGHATRQFSQKTEQSRQYYRQYSPGLGQLSQAYRQPAQRFGQAPPQNYGQSPEGYPQLSSLDYRHELPSHLATAWVNDPASTDESRWKRPILKANATVASNRVRFICQTKVHLLGALLGFAGLLYFLI